MLKINLSQVSENMGAMIISRICLRILCICFTIKAYGAINDNFENEAKSIIKLVEENLQVDECIKDAEEKANRVNEKYGDRHYAALWISMYSRVCLIDKNLLKQDKNQNKFPFRLNKEIRCLRNTKRDPIVRYTFDKVRSIIDDSLDIFGMKWYVQLYRGMSAWTFHNQTYFVDEGYFSTSTDATPALRFANGQYFLIVQYMYGLEIGNYVQDKFKYQKEVLGKSGKMFKIDQKVTDNAQIKQILNNLAVNWDKLIGIDFPHTIFYITEDSEPTKRQEVLDLQWPFMESYCSIDVSSADLAVKELTIIQGVLVILSRLVGSFGEIIVHFVIKATNFARLLMNHICSI